MANNQGVSRKGGIPVSPAVIGFGVLDAMIAAQAAYAARDLKKKSRKRKR
jgi:hypothetical protein